MPDIHELGAAIDAACDANNISQLKRLSRECQEALNTATDEDRVLLLYYKSNSIAGIAAARSQSHDYLWGWHQPERTQSVLLLRQAVREPAFKAMDEVRRHQIRTNLANCLKALGRPVAANEQWLRVLSETPHHAKALANRATALVDYARHVYDEGHSLLLLSAARRLFDRAIDKRAFWESGDRSAVVPSLIKRRDQVHAFLLHSKHNDSAATRHWSLGSTRRERRYRRWCLRERLFLNPLNDASTKSVCATDVLHLPSHTYTRGEEPRFPEYYNLLKQEYVSARYRLYRVSHEKDPVFLTRDVLMLAGENDQVLGHCTEELRAAFRGAYALFDKIGLFLNDYFQAGRPERKVNFRTVWFKEKSRGELKLHSTFEGRTNWLLRGLFFLSKDLFDSDFKDSVEPDAVELATLRHQTEHRFLSLQVCRSGESTSAHRLVAIDDYRHKALRLLRMAREGLVYLSLAMHDEERRKQATRSREDRTPLPRLDPVPLRLYQQL